MENFSEAERKILDVAYETFLPKEYALNVLAEQKSMGIESWIAAELIVALSIRGHRVIKKQKPDLMIDDLKVELKALTNGNNLSWFLSDFTDHPDADIHLFVTAYNEKSLRDLEEKFQERDIIYEHRRLSSTWAVMIAKEVKK